MEGFVRLKDVMGCLYDTMESYHIKRNIMNLPTYDVKPVVRGKWTFKKIFPDDESEFPIGHLVCSVCGSSYPNRTPNNFCPNCGADMEDGNHG